jgi:hypothetical protein
MGRFENEQTPEERGRYAFAEDEARARRAGLWQDKQPVPPWEWRSKTKVERQVMPRRQLRPIRMSAAYSRFDQTLAAGYLVGAGTIEFATLAVKQTDRA